MEFESFKIWLMSLELHLRDLLPHYCGADVIDNRVLYKNDICPVLM